MTFETTSTDYMAASKTSESSEEISALKSRKIRPESEIKIPSVPLSDETTIVSDFKRWNVERPVNHKPKDTLDLTDHEIIDLNRTFIKETSSSRLETSSMETSTSDYKNWQVTRPVIHKPQDNLKSEGTFEFVTTNDDYSARREIANQMVSDLVPLTERTEPDSAATSMQEHTEIMSSKETRDVSSIDNGHIGDETIANRSRDIASITMNDTFQTEAHATTVEEHVSKIKESVEQVTRIEEQASEIKETTEQNVRENSAQIKQNVIENQHKSNKM
ncbi:uncharacterized protein CEXT_339771 [Caerostris extrusa]|uniref:Uncharacterized protein n=1 Tax=Caerostris extrusa TaxID=172846 RepID=A0AAV4XIA9_CAEEX|nr:uncharacterized protein CEXT_339771 [Caerostris extrusa]